MIFWMCGPRRSPASLAMEANLRELSEEGKARGERRHVSNAGTVQPRRQLACNTA